MLYQVFLLFCSGFCFSFMSLFVKLANTANVSAGYGSLQISTTILFRSAPTIPFILFWCYTDWRKRSKQELPLISKESILWLNLRGVVGTFSMYCVFYGNIHLPLGTSVVLYNTNPFFLTLLAPLLLSEKINVSSFAMAILGFIFVALLMSDSFSGSFEIENALVTLGGGFFSAIAYSSVKRLSQTPTPWVILSLATWGVVLSLFFQPQIPKSSAAFHWLLASSIPAILGQMFLTKAYQKGNAQAIAPAQYFGPVAATALGIVVLNESLSFAKIAGSLGIVACGIALPLLKLSKLKEGKKALLP